MWFDTQRLERKVWISNKWVCPWTTDGKEVAYMESNDEEDDSEILHFIDIEGNLISRGLKLKRVSVEILWILRHVILIATDENVYSADKISLKKSKLFSWPPMDEGSEVSKFIPMVGVRFLRTHEPGEDDYQDSVTLNILEEETMTLDTHFPWRNRKLLAFYNRNQGESEHEGKYLEAIKNLAFEAGFKEDSKMFKSYIVNRFLDGVHDAALKSKILAQNSNPSLEDLDSICNTNGFDLLLSRNVEHICENP